MKILCVTPWFPRHRQDQFGNFILDSVEALVALGHEVTVLTTEPWIPLCTRFLHKKRKKESIEVFTHQFRLVPCRHLAAPRWHLFRLTRWIYQWRVGYFLKKLIREFPYDLIHAHTEVAGMAAIATRFQHHIPIVVTLHGMSTDKKLYQGSIRSQLFEYPLTKADRVVLVGEPLISFVRKFVKNMHHIRVVANGFRQSIVHTKLPQKKFDMTCLRFISVSNLQEGKGIDINLCALYQLKKRGITNWTYHIVGAGEEQKRLENQVKEWNMETQVFFQGGLQHHLVYDQLTQADVFILPSYREAFGVAYLEAMSCGLLTIGTQGQGPQAFIQHGKTGFLVYPKDVLSLTDVMISLFKFPEKMQMIAAAGQMHVQQYFTWRHHAEALTTVFQEVVRTSAHE